MTKPTLKQLLKQRAIDLGFIWREHKPSKIRYRYLLINWKSGCAGFDHLNELSAYLDEFEAKEIYEIIDNYETE